MIIRLQKDTTPCTLTELLAEQAKDAFCREATPTNEIPSSWDLYGCNGILVPYALVYGAVQTFPANGP